ALDKCEPGANESTKQSKAVSRCACHRTPNLMKKPLWNEWWQSRRYDVAAISLIVLFFLAFFWPVLSSGKYFVTSDGFVYSFPLRTVAWNSIRAGQVPLWSPLIFSGYPLLSMAQIGIG